jgi:tetratricopeptide (TPR) repeat protein
VRAGRVDLFDLGLRLLEELAVRVHGQQDSFACLLQRLRFQRIPGLRFNHVEDVEDLNAFERSPVLGDYGRWVSPRARVTAIVAAAAAAAAAITIGITVATSSGDERTRALEPRPGAPPLALDLGVRIDPEARALRRASRLHNDGSRRAAATIFERYESLEAKVGLAFARWPDDSLQMVEALSASHVRSAFVQLHLGLAQFWAGHGSEALAAWRAAVRVEPDSASAVRADDLLHPNFPRGRPPFIPSEPPPPAVERLRPDEELAALARAARRPDPHAKLLYGAALQQLGRPLSAERQFAAAARLAPGNAEARTAAAVGLFSKAAPARAFARLGPLTRRFPRAATVRFHLGLLLLWIGGVERAKRELRRAVALDGDGPLGREAGRFLDRLRASER